MSNARQDFELESSRDTARSLRSQVIDDELSKLNGLMQHVQESNHKAWELLRRIQEAATEFEEAEKANPNDSRGLIVMMNHVSKLGRSLSNEIIEDEEWPPQEAARGENRMHCLTERNPKLHFQQCSSESEKPKATNGR
ncbi:MAG: hypothetical protein Q9168_003827 [Polycauliona sp. 1 TL-2023]